MKSPCQKFLVLIFLLSCSSNLVQSKIHQNSTSITVGVVGDINSSFGRMMSLCMDMAISDFYSAHPRYNTRLHLHKMDAGNVLDLNRLILESAQRGEVVGILGSSDEPFASAVGETASMPVVSFTTRSSAASHPQHGYFIRAALDDAVQAEALAALCQRFEWTQVVMLYEDTECGQHFLSHSIKVFQDANIGFSSMVSISTTVDKGDILKQLIRLKGEQTKVFLVHTNPGLGYQLFDLADASGMMSEGYAWIITDSMSIFLNDNKPSIHSSMDGVLGIRPHVFPSKNLVRFQQKWKRNMLVNKITTPIRELNVYGLWAYDAVTAIALAVEEIEKVITTKNSSSFGLRLLNKLESKKFQGLAGKFQLAQGKLEPSAYEIFNVVGSGEKTVGFWSPKTGITRGFGGNKELRKIIWPGDSVVQPTGWKIPANGILKVGIPWKTGYKEFVNVEINPNTNHTNATGFSIDVFLEALKVLPFPVDFKFHCYNGTNSTSMNWTYDDMLHMIPREYDMVVGDTAIWAPRTTYIDFSLPYSESGAVLVVKNRKPVDMWIFIKPLRWDLWLAIIAASVLMGVSLRILERRVTTNNAEQVTSHVARPRWICWSPIEALAFPESNIVTNKWSVFTLVCWLFMAFILMQSFTANLSAILTVDQLKFAFSKDYFVGYQKGSYMKTFLTQRLHISESQLRSYPSVEGFHEAMSKGSKNGGIDAIFDDLPCMKIFLNRYGSMYKIVGPTYKTNGFGFAFQRGSSLVPYFSRAILNVTQGPLMFYLEQKNFGPGYSSQDPLSSAISQGTSSLTLWEFMGLFLTVGFLTLFALFCSETSVGQKISTVVGHIIQNGFRCKDPRVHSMRKDTVDGNDQISQESNHVVDNASQCDDVDEIEEMKPDNEVSIALEYVERDGNHGSIYLSSE